MTTIEDLSFPHIVSNLKLKEFLKSKGCDEHIYEKIKMYMEDYAVDDLVTLGIELKSKYGFIEARVNFDDEKSGSFADGILEFEIGIDENNYYMLSTKLKTKVYTKHNHKVPIDTVEVYHSHDDVYEIVFHDSETKNKIYSFKTKITPKMIDDIESNNRVDFDDHIMVRLYRNEELNDNYTYTIESESKSLPRIRGIEIDKETKNLMGKKMSALINK